MRKALVLFLLAILFLSCKQSITEKDILKINGFWEIEKVEFPDGNKKDYKVNETIDYFEIKNNTGFRQKVMPQLDGKYSTNGIKESISITTKNGNYYIGYKTNFGKWNEEIIEIKDSVLVIKNKEKVAYHYKRQVPFSIK